MKKKVFKIKGFGKEVPPDKTAVIIWFVQQGSNDEAALAFFNFYASKSWRNNRGRILKDWKMRAWDWLWSKVAGYVPSR